MMTPEQCRAGRALLGWTQSDLERESGVARKTLADFENSNRSHYDRTIADVQRALERGGITFLEPIPFSTFGPGVQLKKSKAQVETR